MRPTANEKKERSYPDTCALRKRSRIINTQAKKSDARSGIGKFSGFSPSFGASGVGPKVRRAAPTRMLSDVLADGFLSIPTLTHASRKLDHITLNAPAELFMPPCPLVDASNLRATCFSHPLQDGSKDG